MFSDQSKLQVRKHVFLQVQTAKFRKPITHTLYQSSHPKTKLRNVQFSLAVTELTNIFISSTKLFVRNKHSPFQKYRERGGEGGGNREGR